MGNQFEEERTVVGGTLRRLLPLSRRFGGQTPNNLPLFALLLHSHQAVFVWCETHFIPITSLDMIGEPKAFSGQILSLSLLGPALSPSHKYTKLLAYFLTGP